MERRTFLKSIAATEALLITVGCMGGGSEPQPTASIETGNETGNSTTGKMTTEAEPAEVPSSELILHTDSGVLRIIHMGGEKTTDEGTGRIYVTADDERTATWAANGGKGGEFPVSVGNLSETGSVESGSTVKVVWIGGEGTEEVLTTYEVGTEETATTTTTNETAANETATNGAATSETTTTAATETTTSSGSETSN